MIICDIETRPQANAADSFDESTVKLGNIKDPILKDQKIATERAKFVEKAAIMPFTGAICAIGYIDTDDDTLSHRIEFAYDLEDEYRILTNFWDEIARERVVGYNFLEFDLVWLIERSRKLRVSNMINNYNLAASKVADVYKAIVMVPWAKQNLFPNVKLEQAADHYDVRHPLRKSQCEGKDFWACISSGVESSISMAESHLKADLYETLHLAEVCGLLASTIQH